MQDSQTLSWPLGYILKGIHRSVPKHSRKRRLPITPELLRKMHTTLSQQPRTFDKVMLWAACCLGLFGFMRAGEFTCQSLQPAVADTSLAAADTSIDSRDNLQVLSVHLRYSKTDPFGVGVHLLLGRTGDVTLCPFAATLGYLALQPKTPGPLFIFQDGSPLSRAQLVKHVREVLMLSGVDTTGYSGHSFRIGAASTAAKAGISDSLIQTLGRWMSAAFITYNY